MEKVYRSGPQTGAKPRPEPEPAPDTGRDQAAILQERVEKYPAQMEAQPAGGEPAASMNREQGRAAGPEARRDARRAAA
nr:hypothetical protein [uncultured Rhodopila sp.]